MTKLLSYSLTVILTLLTISSCTYDNEDDYFEEEDICGTNSISFAEDVFTVIENNCISCHGSISPTAGINLSDYSSIKSVAETGKLLSVIKHENGFPAMPPDGTKLSDCSIEKIEAWIEQEFPQ